MITSTLCPIEYRNINKIPQNKFPFPAMMAKLLYNGDMLKKVAKIAKNLGLGWGGDWTSIVDTPHFYLKKWGSTTAKLKQLYGTPDKFKKTWYKTTTYSKNGGLPFWKNQKNINKKKHGRIPKGKKVGILSDTVIKVGSKKYQKVSYNGKYGYVNTSYLK